MRTITLLEDEVVLYEGMATSNINGIKKTKKDQ